MHCPAPAWKFSLSFEIQMHSNLLYEDYSPTLPGQMASPCLCHSPAWSPPSAQSDYEEEVLTSLSPAVRDPGKAMAPVACLLDTSYVIESTTILAIHVAILR